jgi:ubiquinone/menaquinone biosynthesis C-methylase UbiE
MSTKQHWQQVYSTKSTDQVGWYAPHLTTSIKWITDLDLDPDDPVIDVGGGASTLADDLLDKGYRKVSVLDLSDSAISVVKKRLGTRASQISWLLGDVTEVDLPVSHFELWHDRAVFHFLVEPGQQMKYRDKLLRALKPGARFIIGVFELEAPPQCSGLPVERYSVEKLSAIFGAEFNLERHQKEMHKTPSGVEQQYLYCQFQRTA